LCLVLAYSQPGKRYWMIAGPFVALPIESTFRLFISGALSTATPHHLAHFVIVSRLFLVDPFPNSSLEKH
jgi:hypothetical protein